CAAGACPEGGVCTDLSLGAPLGSMDAWRAPLCLRGCERDDQCPLGQRCRLVPMPGEPAPLPLAPRGPSSWTHACFGAFPNDLGASCRSGSGELRNELCLGGHCADLGALGVCSVDCSVGACPEGTACASFNDGRKLCLRPCGAANACRDDPLLACAPSG